MNLEVLKIKKENIFCEDFNHLSRNNIIDFDIAKINVLYAPNGVGKSSLCKVLNGDGEFMLKYNNNTYDNSNCDIFHVINDQNSRNIIKGNAKDFLLGDDIVREFNLKEWLDQNFKNIFENLKKIYKDDLNIYKKSDKKIDYFESNIREIIKLIVKSGAKPSDINISDFIQIVSSLENINIDLYDDEKMKLFINELGS